MNVPYQLVARALIDICAKYAEYHNTLNTVPPNLLTLERPSILGSPRTTYQENVELRQYMDDAKVVEFIET